MSDEKTPTPEDSARDRLKVALPDTMPPDATPEKIVDAEIAHFNEWFTGRGNDPINKFEHAIIKTFLGWKLGLAKPV